MPLGEYPKNLGFLEQHMRSYLEPCSHGTLSDLAEKLKQTIRRHRRGRTPFRWSITIPKENPLKFKSSNDCGRTSHVDLFCRIEGEARPGHFDTVAFKSYSVVFRMWSHDKDISYRNEWDADELEQKLRKQQWKRVVKRFHLDLRNKDTRLPEPSYHLHFGGIADEDEYSWVPQTIGEPRLHYFPLDLVLLCELILMNFFPARSRSLRESPEWKSLVIKSQDLYFKSYFEKLSEYLKDGRDTLLGHLTNSMIF